MSSPHFVKENIARRRLAGWVRKQSVLRESRLKRSSPRAQLVGISARMQRITRQVLEDAVRHADPRDIPSRMEILSEYRVQLAHFRDFRNEVFERFPQLNDESHDSRIKGLMRTVKEIARKHYSSHLAPAMAELIAHELHVRKYLESGFFFRDINEVNAFLRRNSGMVEHYCREAHIPTGKGSDAVWLQIQGGVTRRLLEYNPMESMLPNYMSRVLREEYIRYRSGSRDRRAD